MIVHKAAKFRLYPTPEQAALMAQFAGVCRFVYNLALEQRRDWYRPGRKFSLANQCQELTGLRAEVDWIRAAPVHALQQALRDLDRAYQNWWSGRAAAPKPRVKGVNDSFRFSDPKALGFKRTGKSTGQVKLPKLGWVKFRGWRSLPGEICNVTVSCKAGRWYAAIQCEREVDNPAPSNSPTVGIDMGVAVFATLSNGTTIAPANHGKKALRALRKAQRALARKKRGSKNRRKAVQRVARLQKRVGDARKDFLHKHSTAIAKSHGIVVVEDLKVENMTASARGTVENPGTNVRQKSGLNRAILDQGWGMFFGFLEYKLADRGGRLIKVPPAFTSQTCPECGCVDRANRPSQAVFCCVHCGFTANADFVASVNIERRADSALKPVEGTASSGPLKQEPAGSLPEGSVLQLHPPGRSGCRIPIVFVHDFGDGEGPVPAHRHRNPDGSIGGWISNTATVVPTAWIGLDAQVYGRAEVHDQAKILDQARVFDDAIVMDAATIRGAARIYGFAWIFDQAVICGNAQVFGNAQVGDAAYVAGWTRVYGDAIVHFEALTGGEYTEGLIGAIYPPSGPRH